MNKSITRSKAIMLIVIAFVLFGYGCDKVDPHHLEPEWLGGSNIETLEERGNYEIFLQLMVIAGYEDPIKKQLFTLFVPDDEAFKAYFQEIGISSVTDLSQDEAIQLFTLHVLRNPRSRYQLIYEYAWGEEQGPTGEYASLFNRKATLSTSIPYNEEVKYNPTYKGKTLLMYTDHKIVPLWTVDFFEDFFADTLGSDYNFIYRDSEWGGSMNWHNAKVIEEEVRTANGFINFIDKVVPPMPNIDEYLSKKKETHGLYYDLAQRFALYVSPKTDKQKRMMYKKSYNMLFDFANENEPPSDNPSGMKNYYTLFAPSDAVLQAYLDKTVLKYYSSIDSVPEITLFYILQTQLTNSLGLISKMSQSFFNAFGDAMTIQATDIRDAYMCSNGVFYDMNKVLEPNVFSCVPGRLFFDPNYSTFLNAINLSGLIGSISNPEMDVTLFAPNNEQMDAYNLRYNSLKDVIETVGDDGIWFDMKAEDLILFVQDHIYPGKLNDLSGDGFIEMASKNFVHYKNNTLSAGENQLLGEVATIVEKNENEKNGYLYTINNAIKSVYSLGELLVETPEYSKFAELLIATSMLDPNYVDQTTLDTIPNLKFLSESYYWTAFIPDNSAMAAAEASGLVPTETDELKKFLLYHFIKKNVIFDDGLVSGTFETSRVEEVTTDGVKYSELDFTNTKNSLKVTDHSGQKITIDHKNANRLVTRGVVHTITSTLKF